MKASAMALVACKGGGPHAAAIALLLQGHLELGLAAWTGDWVPEPQSRQAAGIWAEA